MVAPAAGAGGCGGEEQEQEFDICNDEGFVYKVPSGLYPDAAPSSTQAAAGPDPEIAGLRRRRRALLRLRAKRLRDLSRWEALASEHLAPLPAPQPPASQAPPASPNPVAATATAAAASGSVLDDLIAQVNLRLAVRLALLSRLLFFPLYYFGLVTLLFYWWLCRPICRRSCSGRHLSCATRSRRSATRTKRPSWMTSPRCRYGATRGSL